MTPNEYQEKAHSFAIGGGDTLVYSILGLFEESGELLEKTCLSLDPYASNMIECCRAFGINAKHIRKNWNEISDDMKMAFKSVKAEEGAVAELGDILWMVANIAHHLGVKLEDVMKMNIEKLEERVKTGTIIGNGDTIEERLANAGK